MKFTTARRAATVGLLAAGAVVVAGCAPSTASDPASLSVLAPQGGPATDLATNAFTEELESKFDIKFDWATTTWDSGPAKEKRQIALASGDYPDLFLLVPWIDQFSQGELIKLSSDGIVVPLNELIEKYAPNVKEALESEPDFAAMATAPDGNIYGLPQWVDCYHCTWQSKLWMNSEWLDTLGLEQPTTTEELREVLRAFKTQDPNGNGLADEIPLTGNTRDSIVPYLMNAFVYDPQGQIGVNGSTLVLKDGAVSEQAVSDGWREGLEYIKSLYDEGLIDQGSFSQSPAAALQLGDNPDAVLVGAAAGMHPAIYFSLAQEDGRDKNYDAVPPIAGPDGTRYASYVWPSTPGATFVLTNKATEEEQIKAIKMIDFMFTTAGMVQGMFGVEGETWEVPGPDDIALDAELEPMFKLKSGEDLPTNVQWGPLSQYNYTQTFKNSEAVSDDIYSPAGFERRLLEATDLYAGHENQDEVFPYWRIWTDPSVATELATLKTNIETSIQQNSTQFITGDKNIETDWDAYVDGLYNLGLERYLEIQQTAYDELSK